MTKIKTEGKRTYTSKTGIERIKATCRSEVAKCAVAGNWKEAQVIASVIDFIEKPAAQ